MLKVLVYGSGWGGELFANYLENELATVEIIRLADWQHAPHAKHGKEKLKAITDMMIKPYVGRVDVIVLASYMITEVTLGWLRRRYPDQTFLGFEMKLFELTENAKFKRLLVAGEKKLLKSRGYLASREYLQRVRDVEVLELNCDGWVTLIDNDAMTSEVLTRTLAEYDWKKDLIVLYGTHFVDVKPQLEKIFGWRMRVVDDFYNVMREIHCTLGLDRQYTRLAGTIRKARQPTVARLQLAES